VKLYRAVKATSRAQAISTARRVCRCHRMSFAGVKWTEEDGRSYQLTWAEVDAG
jgi:hypothetical protein